MLTMTHIALPSQLIHTVPYAHDGIFTFSPLNGFYNSLNCTLFLCYACVLSCTATESAQICGSNVFFLFYFAALQDFAVLQVPIGRSLCNCNILGQPI